MNVICFGDSNTYGYDPRSFLGGRYEAEHRWVDLLAVRTGWTIRNEGVNGREIPSRAIAVPEQTDLLVVMLGSNDLMQGNSVRKVTERMACFLTGLNIPPEKILLIAPPKMKLGQWVPTQSLIDASVELAGAYRGLAKQLGVRFADSGEWGVPMTYDGVHFTQEGHRAFAEGLYKELNV